MDYILLVIALGLIVGGAMLLTDGSVALARRLRIPEFIVGLTVVAVGTSMPEMAVSMISAVGGHGDMAIGNVVGSNIANALLILGVCSVFAPVAFTKSNIRRDLPLNILVSLALLFVAYTAGAIERVEGIVLLVGYVAMILYSVSADRKTMTEGQRAVLPFVDYTLMIALAEHNGESAEKYVQSCLETLDYYEIKE